MEKKEISNFQVKYGRRTLYFGFVQTPNLLIQNKKALGLTTSELFLLQYLMSYGSAHEIADWVYPSLKEMSKMTGLSTGTIHAAKDGLVNKGFIEILKKENPYGTNYYNLFPIREKLEHIATRKIEQQFVNKKMNQKKYDELMGDTSTKVAKKFFETNEDV